MKTEAITFLPISAEEQESISTVLKKHYQRTLPAVTAVERFGEPTVASVVYHLRTAEASFILKLSNWRGTDPTAVREQTLVLELANAFRVHRLPVAETIPTDAGALIAADGERAAIVQRFVKGEHFSGSDAELIAAGRGLGVFHAIAARLGETDPVIAARVVAEITIEKPYPDCVRQWNERMRADLLNDAFHKSETTPHCARAPVCDLLRETIPTIDRLIGEMDSAWAALATPLPTGIIHNDFHPNNGLYANGSLVALLDFELVCNERFVIDLANSMMRHIANVGINRPDADLRTATETFLRAYEQERPLSADERKVIPFAMLEREMQRLLRRLWMHMYENDRMGNFMDKIPSVVLPNLLRIEERYAFLL